MQGITCLFAALLCFTAVAAFVVTTVPSDETFTTISPDTSSTIPVEKPTIRSLIVESEVKYRYAHTVISSRVANPAHIAQEVFFTAVLPETAFISGFKMILDDHVYDAYVKEKEKAKAEYAEAVSQGRTAAHVALSARDSNRIVVSVNVEPMKKVTFNLTYEELLMRKLSAYHHVINLDPGQIVDNVRVTVKIEEASEIVSLRVPPLRTSNEILDDTSENNDPLVNIERPSYTSAVITWAPTPDQQRELAAEGIKGQLEVEYDVIRVNNPGEIMVRDGYFVHFFAPEGIQPLPKHVTFILDVSGSMFGRKIEQLKQAMNTILDDLRQGDYFSLIIFSSRVYVWNSELSTSQQMQDMVDPDKREDDIPTIPRSAVVEVNSDNVEKAKDFLDGLPASGATNIYDALRTGLETVRVGRSVILNITEEVNDNDIQSEARYVPEPMIVFLTDGQPNQGGITEPPKIVSNITAVNTKADSIFSLALGTDADFDFLKKLSLRNAGFARKIYEAADTALQLRDFYRQVSSPLLAHVNFTYTPSQIDEQSMTTLSFRRVFAGSEIVVAGKLSSSEVNLLNAEVGGNAPSGRTVFNFMYLCTSPICSTEPVTFEPIEYVADNSTNYLERLWAYLTVQQLLEKVQSCYDEEDDCEDEDDYSEPTNKQRALDLALKYSFVTPVTSLVVVKPNDTTSSVQTEDAAHEPQALPSPGVRSSSTYGFVAKAPIAAPHSSFPAGPGSYAGSGALGLAGAGLAGLPGIPRPIAAVPNVQDTLPPLITPIPPAQQASLDDIVWLGNFFNASALYLPIGPNNTTEVLKLAPETQTNEAYDACVTPISEPGHCRYLKYCVLTSFTNHLVDYVPYLCRIEGEYAGVCCPDRMQPVSTK